MSKRKGDLIISCEPYVHVLLHSQRTVRCESCLERSDTLKKCTACKLVRYCNVNCQRSDWNIHKKECLCYKRVSPNVPLESVRLLLKLLIRHVNGDEAQVWPGDPGWCTFNQLMSHKTELQEDRARCEQFAQMMFTIQKLVGDGFVLPSGDEMMELFGKMTINTFTICDGECQPIGTGIYVSASKLDHSCVPNIVAVFRGKTLRLRAVQNIENTCTTPENLYLSYIDQLNPTADRQTDLQTQYYFLCECEKCQAKKLDQLMLSTKCQNNGCNAVVYRDKDAYDPSLTDPSLGVVIKVCDCDASSTAASNCISDSTQDVVKSLQEARDKLANIEQVKKKGELKEALSLCEGFVKTQGSILHDYNVYLVKCIDRAFDICVETEMWEKALEYGRETIRGFRLYYPDFSPVVGVQMMKIGKLELYLKHLNTALTHLHQARDILLVTHGRDHPLFEDLIQLIDQCEEEMRSDLERSHKHPF